MKIKYNGQYWYITDNIICFIFGHNIFSKYNFVKYTTCLRCSCVTKTIFYQDKYPDRKTLCLRDCFSLIKYYIRRQNEKVYM